MIYIIVKILSVRFRATLITKNGFYSLLGKSILLINDDSIKSQIRKSHIYENFHLSAIFRYHRIKQMVKRLRGS